MSDWHNRSHCNRTHVDEGVLIYFYDVLGCRSMLDIGCGPGGQTEAAIKVGYSGGMAVDGDYDVLKPLKQGWVCHDFLEAAFVPKFSFDLAWCCEFLEHIPEDKLDNVWPCFDACKYAAITAHPPTGVENEFHFNEQGEEYWLRKFNERGWVDQAQYTDDCRKASTMKRDFFRDHGLVFFNPNWRGK